MWRRGLLRVRTGEGEWVGLRDMGRGEAVPSKVHLFVRLADSAAALAAAIMAGELSMPWMWPDPGARICAISRLRTPSGS